MTELENIEDIRRVARTLLRRADVADRLPTPVRDIVDVAGLDEVDDFVLSESKIRQAPAALRKLLRGAARKVRGALDRRERVLHVSPTVSVPAQRNFVRCHEIMHDALPWQRDLLVLGDTAQTLAPNIELLFEREANQGGAELLFQLDLLATVARDYPTDITTPVALAEMFGSSIHATFRRWVETHEHAVCGLVLSAQPVSRAPVTYRRFELIESSAWTAQFGWRRFPHRPNALTYPFLTSLSKPFAGQTDSSWMLDDANGETTAVTVQSFCNTYRTFVLVRLPTRERFIARHRRRPTLEVV